jgi:two-component system KDP operon response regulator KdpE
VTHVLVVEDDPSLRRSLTMNLTARGYSVDDSGNGEDALRLAGRRIPDVVLLDLGLPTISGLEVISGIRAWSDVPIIVLSARGAEQDKVEALDRGANDYVTKPFGVEELMARVRAAERLVAARGDPAVVTTADFRLDLTAKEISRHDGSRIRLTPIEWALLEHLARHPGAVVERTELLTAVWGPGFERETNYLRVHVTHLRKKIEPDPARPRYVLTEPGIGYRFTPS